MAKKRFTDDLFGLFEEPTPVTAASRAEPEAGAHAKQEEESVEVDVPTPSPGAKRKLSSKKFTADLDSFLSDSFERENIAPPTSSAPAPPPRPRRRKTGLDLLIRSTVADEDRMPSGENTAETKRVTLIFKKDHLAELKDQAKGRGMYLKDVVQEMVARYLEEEGE
jgi:hypothetical protein